MRAAEGSTGEGMVVDSEEVAAAVDEVVAEVEKGSGREEEGREGGSEEVRPRMEVEETVMDGTVSPSPVMADMVTDMGEEDVGEPSLPSSIPMGDGEVPEVREDTGGGGRRCDAA